MPDGEPGRDERWDDDGDLGGDDDGDGGHDTFEYLADDNGYDYDDKYESNTHGMARNGMV